MIPKEKESKTHISFLLRQYRSSRGMSQEDLASFLGCRVEQVNRWERCKYLPGNRWLAVMVERGVI